MLMGVEARIKGSPVRFNGKALPVLREPLRSSVFRTGRGLKNLWKLMKIVVGLFISQK